MTDGETEQTRLPVTKAARDVAREAKRDDETWSDYVRRCAENPPPVEVTVTLGHLEDILGDERAEAAREGARQAVREALGGEGGGE